MLKAFDAALAAQRSTTAARIAWDEEAAEFKLMQRALSKTLSTASTPACVMLRKWRARVRARIAPRRLLQAGARAGAAARRFRYTFDDLMYEAQVDDDGYVRPPPAVGEAAMMRAYKKSGKTLFC